MQKKSSNKKTMRKQSREIWNCSNHFCDGKNEEIEHVSWGVHSLHLTKRQRRLLTFKLKKFCVKCWQVFCWFSHKAIYMIYIFHDRFMRVKLKSDEQKNCHLQELNLRMYIIDTLHQSRPIWYLRSRRFESEISLVRFPILPSRA